MKIEIWNDFCVPHCYTGETLLLRAITQMGLASQIDIKLRAFELDPTFPQGKTVDVPHCVARKYGCTLPEALEKIEMTENMARAAGIDMKFKTAVFCNTRNAHRLMKFAYATYGNEMALKLNFALFAAYFTQNLILDVETLQRIAEHVDMEPQQSADVLKSAKYESEVIDDEKEAAARGIYAIPYFDFDGKFSVGGSMSQNGFMDAIARMIQGEKQDEKDF